MARRLTPEAASFQSVTLFNALLISTEKTGVYVLIIQVLDVTDA